mgnify:CR=1 FL=1
MKQKKLNLPKLVKALNLCTNPRARGTCSDDCELYNHTNCDRMLAAEALKAIKLLRKSLRDMRNKLAEQYANLDEQKLRNQILQAKYNELERKYKDLMKRFAWIGTLPVYREYEAKRIIRKEEIESRVIVPVEYDITTILPKEMLEDAIEDAKDYMANQIAQYMIENNIIQWFYRRPEEHDGPLGTSSVLAAKVYMIGWEYMQSSKTLKISKYLGRKVESNE